MAFSSPKSKGVEVLLLFTSETGAEAEAATVGAESKETEGESRPRLRAAARWASIDSWTSTEETDSATGRRAERGEVGRSGARPRLRALAASRAASSSASPMSRGRTGGL